MLKKAGIVVLGAAAGMLSLAPLASAGESPSHDRSHHHHNDRDRDFDFDFDGGDCGDKVAFAQGDSLVGLDNAASNLELSNVNILATDNSLDDCDGGGDSGGDSGGDAGGDSGGDAGGDSGGDEAAIASGDSLVSANNLLANTDISHVNVLATDNSR